MSRLGTGVMVATLLTAAGCSSYHAFGTARAVLPFPPELQQYYGYPSSDQKAQVRLLEQHPTYSVKQVTLASAGDDEPIQLIWFAPNTTKPSPLILISPIRGSDTLVVEGCAEAFAADGYHAAIVKRAHYHFDPAGPLTQVEDSLRNGVIRHRQALDWLLTQPGIDPKRVGTFGISYGGILTAALAGIDQRVKVSVIDLAGGPLAGVMSSSKEGSLRRDWSRSRVCHDLTNKELYTELGDVIRTDPVKLAPYVARDHVLMLIARFDSSVPTPYQVKLWRALGKPRADFVPLGHYTSILALPAHRLNVMRFFEENFAQTGPVVDAGIQAKN
jgi:prolyl oligopeptidase family protein